MAGCEWVGAMLSENISILMMDKLIAQFPVSAIW
jgi:hypothetical protein